MDRKKNSIKRWAEKKIRADNEKKRKKEKKIVKKSKKIICYKEECPKISFFLCSLILIPLPKNSPLPPKIFRNHLA